MSGIPVTRELLDSYVSTVRDSVTAQRLAVANLRPEVDENSICVQSLRDNQLRLEMRMTRIESDLEACKKLAIEYKERVYMENSARLLVFTGDPEDLEEFIKAMDFVFRRAPSQFSSDMMKCSFFVSCLRGRAEDFALQLQRASLWASIPLLKDYALLIGAVRGRFGAPVVAMTAQQLSALGKFAVDVLSQKPN